MTSDFPQLGPRAFSRRRFLSTAAATGDGCARRAVRFVSHPGRRTAAHHPCVQSATRRRLRVVWARATGHRI